MKYLHAIPIFSLFLLLGSVLPSVGYAAEQTVTIESERNDAFDYLEYHDGSEWKDLNTPMHWIESTGQVCYCVEHSAGNPHGEVYNATGLSSLFSDATIRGLQVILMNGYPCVTPSGFTADQARQATANAIRFWLSEQGEPGSMSFTNRKTNPSRIRAKSGYEHVLEWADELLAQARAGEQLTHSISLSPSPLTLKRSGDVYTGTLTVTLSNINRGYTLSYVNKPSGLSVSGYTGNQSETLIFSVPASTMPSSFQVQATGKDTRSLSNITAYTTTSDCQNIVLCANTEQVVAQTTLDASFVLGGSVRFKKTTEQYNAKTKSFSTVAGSGFVFGLYAEEALGSYKKGDLVEKITTDSSGIGKSTKDLPLGSYSLCELSAPASDILLSSVSYPLSVTGENTYYVTNPIHNERVKSRIVLSKTDASGHPLSGATFQITDANDALVETLTTDTTGTARSSLLPAGSYTVSETKAPEGYLLDSSAKAVEISSVSASEISLSFTNIPNSVTLLRTDSKTGSPIFGATVRIKSASGSFNRLETTDAQGAIRLEGLPADTYTYSEVTPALGYAHNNGSYTFLVSSTGSVSGSLACLDDPTEVRVTKTDKRTGLSVEGAGFRVYNENGVLVRTTADADGRRIPDNNGDSQAYTDEDGSLTFRYLPKGSYTLEELAPDGYVPADPVSFEVTDATTVNSPLTLTVQNAPTGLLVKKLDYDTQEPLTGASFRFSLLEGNEYKELSFSRQADGSFLLDSQGAILDIPTDENGEVLLLGLPIGTVYLEETIRPDGYFPISSVSAEITAKHSSETPLELLVYNSKFVKLGLDNDRFETPLLILAASLAAGLAVGLVLVRKKRKKMCD